MSLADQLLIGWWVAFIVLFIPLIVLIRRDARQNRPKVTSRFLRGASSLASALLLVLMFSYLVMTGWMIEETRLHILNVQVFLIGLGVTNICLAFWPNWLRLRPLFNRAFRLFFFAGGVLILSDSMTPIKDIFYPWRVAEGSVEGLRAADSGHWIRLDGLWYRTTNEIYSGLRIGDRVRAEIGTGSDMIFRAQPIPVTPR